MKTDKRESRPLDLDLFDLSYAEYRKRLDLRPVRQRLWDLFEESFEDLIKEAYAAGYRAAGGLTPDLSSFSTDGDDQDEDE